MQQEVALHDEIAEFIHVDAGGKDEKQIADIADLVAGGKCDVLIVSPNTTAALTPAVEKACEALPVIVFDRGVQTDCPVVFTRPIGGYAFGYTGAKFIVDNLPNGGNVLALRILPGVDVLEHRWAAAKQVFEANPQLNVIGVEFGDGDNAKVKGIVNDYLDRFGTIDAVWMDAGATAVAALEAFQDAGKPFPVMVGEDQQDYLKFWKENNLTAVAPTFPTYQWRTPIIAALKILKGEQVQHIWTLPQPTITAANLDQYYNDQMPPLHYAMCGCEGMPTFPRMAWLTEVSVQPNHELRSRGGPVPSRSGPVANKELGIGTPTRHPRAFGRPGVRAHDQDRFSHRRLQQQLLEFRTVPAVGREKRRPLYRVRGHRRGKLAARPRLPAPYRALGGSAGVARQDGSIRRALLAGRRGLSAVAARGRVARPDVRPQHHPLGEAGRLRPH